MKISKPRLAINILSFTFIVFLVIAIFQTNFKINDLKLENEMLNKQVEQVEAYVRKLNDKIGREVNEEYVEEIARAKLNLVLPEEIIFYNDLVE